MNWAQGGLESPYNLLFLKPFTSCETQTSKAN